MKIILTTEELDSFCAHARTSPFVTVDTEFVRDNTYFPQLCLIQLALPDSGEWSEVVIDTINGNACLDSLYDVFRDRSIVKVFHSARQDLEIFFLHRGEFPEPLFDTQVAAMACGYGESVGYRVLARDFAKAKIDKASQFTHWDRRPLSKRQLSYALSDVTHLRDVYLALSAELAVSGREDWVADELALLTDRKTYLLDPREAWKRIGVQDKSLRNLAIVREIAQFREEQARANDVPRNRILTNETIIRIAAAKPATRSGLLQNRFHLHYLKRRGLVDQLLQAVRRGIECPEKEFPTLKRPRPATRTPCLAQLLRVLLRARATRYKVAPRLIATSEEIDEIAAGNPECRALHGWRLDVFGRDALELCSGKSALRFNGSALETVTLRPK